MLCSSNHKNFVTDAGNLDKKAYFKYNRQDARNWNDNAKPLTDKCNPRDSHDHWQQQTEAKSTLAQHCWPKDARSKREAENTSQLQP